MYSAKPPGESFFNFRALRIVPVFAIVTLHAGQFRGDKYTIARFIFFYGRAYREHFRAYLMPLYQRRPREPIPFDDVTAADTAGNNLDQHFLALRLRSRDIFNTDIFVIITSTLLSF